MPLVQNPAWSRYFAWGRLPLILTACAAAWSSISRTTPAPVSPAVAGLLAAVVLTYGTVFLWWQPRPGGASGMAALFTDTVLLLVFGMAAPEWWWAVALMYLFVLLQAVALFRPREVAIVSGAAVVWGAVMTDSAARTLEPAFLVGGALSLAFAWQCARDRAYASDLEAELVAARRAAAEAAEQERLRIGGDFHDGPLQNFISLQMRLAILRKLLERDLAAGMSELGEVQAVAQAQVGELRAFLRGMRPLETDGADLVASARHTAEAFQKESGIPVTFVADDSGGPAALPRQTSQEVLQMLRESLHNVRKHAGATRVAVGLERDGSALEISVEDNGRGFQFAGRYSLEELETLRLGPASLKRRARALHASLQLDSRPGRGAGLKVRIPLS